MSAPRSPSEEDLKNISDFFYTHEGKLFARVKYARRISVGQEVGCDNGQGYLIVMCRYKLYLVHRIIYYLHNGVWPQRVVDHINGNSLDNRPENLREVSQGENMRSFGSAHKDSKSKFRGVSPLRSGKWSSEIMYQGKRRRKSGFESELEAALWYNIQAEDLGFSKEAFNNVFESVKDKE